MSKSVRKCMYHANCNGHSLYFNEPSLTKQSFKDECDINIIVERAQLGSDIRHVSARVGQYGDFTDVPDFMTALNTVNNAHAMFMELPAKLRERFGNDPAKLISFIQDPANRDEGVRLGLFEAPKPVKDSEPPAVDAGGSVKS